MSQFPLRLNDNLDPAHLANSRLISAIRRQTALFIACCLGGLALGILYLRIAEPLYTASASIIIDNRQVRAIHDVSTLSDRPTLDTSEIESQVEVFRSEHLGLAVVKQLKLSEDPAFVEPSRIRKMWAFVMANLGFTTHNTESLSDADAAFERQLTAVETLNRNLNVSRLGHTFVLQVDYTSPNPARAAEIVNGYTSAYMLDQLNSRAEEALRARNWLQQRTEELRKLSVDADLAAQKFKAENHLLATKGTLVSEQQLNEMTTQLVTDQAATAQAKARYLRIKNIIDTHQTEGAVTESLADPVVSDLRTKYLDASKRMSDLERKLGPTHIVLSNLKNTMDELSMLLFQELGRVAQTYQSDYEVAVAREKVLAGNLTRQHSIAVTANDALVKLRQLEQKAASVGTLYETYLQRYLETELFPMADAHIIGQANKPPSPSQPRKPFVLAISLVLGAVVGVGLGRLRESMDRGFRTVEQLRDEIGTDVLGILPNLLPGSLPQLAKRKVADLKPNFIPDAIAPIMRYAIDHPFSAFAETLRAAKVAADLALRDRSPKIIGLVSFLPNEGKSTVAKNFASLLALQSAKTLLIDADTRNPGLSRAIGSERAQDSKSGPYVPPTLAEFVKYEPDSGLQILPCIYAENDPHVAEVFRPQHSTAYCKAPINPLTIS